MHSCAPGQKMPSCNKTVEKRLEKEKEEDYYKKVRLNCEICSPIRILCSRDFYLFILNRKTQLPLATFKIGRFIGEYDKLLLYLLGQEIYLHSCSLLIKLLIIEDGKYRVNYRW